MGQKNKIAKKTDECSKLLKAINTCRGDWVTVDNATWYGTHAILDLSVPKNDEWALISYDISDNSQRDHFREKLIRFGGMHRTDSVYLFPLSVRSFEEIEAYARKLGYLDRVDIATYGARNITQNRKRTAEYKRDLKERKKLMKERVHLFKEQLFEAEE